MVEIAIVDDAVPTSVAYFCSPEQPALLFAYGTLMTDFRNNFNLGASKSLGRARTCDKRFEMLTKMLLL